MIWKDFSLKEDTILNWCEKLYFGEEKFQKELLDKEKSQAKNSKLRVNITYYPYTMSQYPGRDCLTHRGK